MTEETKKLFTRFENAHHASAADDWNEHASESLIKRHYDAYQEARKALIARIESLEQIMLHDSAP